MAETILQVLNNATLCAAAERADEVGAMARMIIRATDPDAEFERLARAYIWNQGQDTRRLKITALSLAFGADRRTLKRWLRAKSIVGEKD